MRKDDAIRLRHMLDAAREALSFAHGKNRGNLSTDRMLVLSLIKSIFRRHHAPHSAMTLAP